jgi:hypothetical protein
MADGRSVFDELADRLTTLADRRARAVSPPVGRGKVTLSDPLTVEVIADVDGTTLEEGDPDVEFDAALLADRPAVGATVRLHHDGEDWIVAGVLMADGSDT